MVAFVGPALRLPVPPQPVANIMATIATAKSKYRFIGASKFSVSGEVLTGDKCTWRAKLAKRAKCRVFNRQKAGAGMEWESPDLNCGDKPHRIKHLRPLAKSNVGSSDVADRAQEARKRKRAAIADHARPLNVDLISASFTATQSCLLSYA